MIKHYIIDGNNLIGKIKSIAMLQKTNRQLSREKLAFLVDRYFILKKVTVTLHFDGYKNEAINTNKIKIEYSENRTADEWIKNEIMVSKNPKTICVVSSDNNIIQFASKSSCTVKKSEKFALDLTESHDEEDEQKKINEISDDEIKMLFGVD